MKKSFNSNLVMLRSRKVTLLEYIRKNNNRMRKINIILNEPASSLKLREPSYTLDDLFENHYQFTDMNRKVANEALRSCTSERERIFVGSLSAGRKQRYCRLRKKKK